MKISFDEKVLSTFKDKIESADSIYMASHISPDGDNLGSLLGLGLALKKINPNVKLVKVDETPKTYQFLPGINLLEEYDEVSEADLFIALDCGDIDRLGPARLIAEKARTLVNIDHHKSNPNYGDINIVYPGKSSTGEIVFELLEALNIEIDVDMATALYTAISTDTGSFIYSSTTARTYEIAGKLLDKGIDLNEIVINVYQSKTVEGTNLYIDSLNTLEFFFDNRLAIIYVSREMLEKNKAKWEDTEGLIPFIRDIDGVEVACLLKEKDDSEIKLSIRSKRYVDVSSISQELGGGGHKRAAGCTVNKTLEEAKVITIEIVERYL